MAKEYKPGQFVSICGKLHRVKKTEPGEITCSQCPYDKSPYIGACEGCIDRLGMHNYPEPIKPKLHDKKV